MTAMNFSYDRYYPGIRAPWKDNGGAVYDFGLHFFDQALKLFGRPAKITAFVQNMRGVNKPEVGDIVRTISVLAPENVSEVGMQPQFAIYQPRKSLLQPVHRVPSLPHPIREGTAATLYGSWYQRIASLDTQLEEEPMPIVSGIFAPRYGQESQEIYGTVKNIAANNTAITTKSNLLTTVY